MVVTVVAVGVIVFGTEREEAVADDVKYRELAVGVPMLVVSPKWTRGAA